jgi:hypothetical protein
MHSDEDDRRQNADEPLRPTRHRIHRNGPYLGINGEVGVDYGDGTPDWLLDALQRRPRDAWGPERDSWHAVRTSWGTDAEDDE